MSSIIIHVPLQCTEAESRLYMYCDTLLLLVAGDPVDGLAQEEHCTHANGRLDLLWSHTVLALHAPLLAGHTLKVGVGKELETSSSGRLAGACLRLLARSAFVFVAHDSALFRGN